MAIDPRCMAAAFCFIISNVLFAFEVVISRSGGSRSKWLDLDPSYLQTRWTAFEDLREVVVIGVLIAALGWLFLMAPIVQMAWVLSRGGKRLVGVHSAIAGLAIMGCLIEMIALFMQAGMTWSKFWLAREFNLDDWTSTGDGTGWRVIEMIRIITNGMIVWIATFESLAVFGIVYLVFYSVAAEPKYKTIEHGKSKGGEDNEVVDETASTNRLQTTTLQIEPTFTRAFISYGLFIGVLAFFDFVATVMRYIKWQPFDEIALYIDILLGCLFLPIWILCLGNQLPDATSQFEEDEEKTSIMFQKAYARFKGMAGAQS